MALHAGRIALLSVFLATAWAPVAAAAPPESDVRHAPAPAPSSAPHPEPTNLDEGKTPAQFFSSSCAVCHQSGQGLAKGRSAGMLASFLRQHYTTSTAQANTLAGYLASGTFDRGRPAAVTPARATPAGRPAPAEPAATARRPAPKPDKPETKPEEGRKSDPAVAAAPPARRLRTEDGRTEPVEGLVVLPPGAADLPAAKDNAPGAGAAPAPGQARPPAAGAPAARDAKPATPAGEPVRQAGAPPSVAAAPAKPPVPVSPLTEEKPIPAQAPEIPL